MTAVTDDLAVAFPGQGSKAPAMVSALTRYWEHPLVKEFRSRAALDDPERVDIRDTRLAQPATYACGLAAAEEILGGGAEPAAVLGHSLGELTALALAGVLDPGDGLALALRRGEICHGQQGDRPGSMIAVMGTDLSGADWVRRLAIARSGGVLEFAGLNGRRQTVLSGDTRTAESAIAVAGEMEVLAEVLPIGGSFHSPLMAGALEPWRAAVEAVTFRSARVPVVSTVDAQTHRDGDELRELLIRALILPVRWMESTHRLRAEGVTRVWDAGPGETLHKLGRREHVVQFVSLPDSIRRRNV